MIDKDLLKLCAEEIGVELDDMALDRFDLMAQRLERWNEHTNLTAITEPDEVVIKHFADSLTVLAAAEIPQGARVADVGCGAGFPGLPLLFARPDLELTFIDSIGKKLAFIKETLKYEGLFGDIQHERAEELGQKHDFRESYDIVVSRAVAALNELCEYCLPLVKVGGSFIAMKGAEDETALAANAIETLGGEIEKIVPVTLHNGDGRNLVVIKKISQTPTKYPRRAKKITSKPL
jgi:16S rRNA (guanine527-N7)-methyltransferase